MFILDTEKLIQKLKEEGDQPLWEYALNQEMERSGRSREELLSLIHISEPTRH